MRPGSPRCSGPSRSPSRVRDEIQTPASSRTAASRARASRSRSGRRSAAVPRRAGAPAREQSHHGRDRERHGQQAGKQVAFRAPPRLGRMAVQAVLGRPPRENRASAPEKNKHLPRVPAHPIEPAGLRGKAAQRARTRDRRAASPRGRPPTAGRPSPAPPTTNRTSVTRDEQPREQRVVHVAERVPRKDRPRKGPGPAVRPRSRYRSRKSSSRQRNAPHWNCRCGICAKRHGRNANTRPATAEASGVARDVARQRPRRERREKHSAAGAGRCS